MKYIYGPVKSRRLGMSLGISLTPHKICSLDCVYCQLGKTSVLTSRRKEYIKIVDILEEIKLWLENNCGDARKLQFVTLSGAGEPSLNIGIGKLISGIKKLTGLSVAVITNASLLSNERLRKDLLAADLIVPSLDAVSQGIFEKIDRPVKGIRAKDIVNGLIKLRKEFPGKIWLEVMIVKGINDSLEEIRKIKAAADKIGPDLIQINSPVRTTTEKNVFSVSKETLKKIKEIFGDKAKII
ncbi:MAG: radical SAM protein [Candidatus Omnitrophica bacterium]|nr:radical SAM protein [Candidatus Omnitrophota bacterium]